VKGIAHSKAVRNRLPITRLSVLLLFLLLFSAYIVALTSCGQRGLGHSGPAHAAEVVDRAEHDLSNFNRIIGSVVLIAGTLFVIYLMKKNGKRGIRRKIHIRHTRQERP